MTDAAAMAVDYLDLARRVFRPTRPQLAEARAVVEGIAAPRRAWEALAAAGVMPGISGDDAQRLFAQPDGGLQSYPPTIQACVTLASDSKGILATEALARESAARLPPWHDRTALRIQWRVGRLAEHDLLSSPPREPTGLLHRWLLAAHEEADTTEWDTEAAWVIHPEVPRRPWPSARECQDQVALGRLTREISACELWRSAALNGYRLPGDARRVEELPDPFAPLFTIWQLGYGLDAISAELIVLVAPPA